MTAPRLEVRLDRLHHNAQQLVGRLGARGITVAGVTKATLGSPEIATTLLRAGVTSIGESRIENIEHLRHAGLTAPMMLIRSPMLSQAARVVHHADVSLNSELDVIDRLSAEACAQGRRHGVVLMVELGDLREGILPGALLETARRAVGMPGIDLHGIGTNHACQSGVVPDQRNMRELSTLAGDVESALHLRLRMVSGGNSANLDWALSSPNVGRVDHLRLGESIVLGREPLRRRPIDGLHLDSVVLVAEVIEAKAKPSRPWGSIEETAFGTAPPLPPQSEARADQRRAIVALGRQDVDVDGLRAPDGMEILGASSDHLVIDPGPHRLAVGSEVRFDLDYSALLRAMTSPFVSRTFLPDAPGRGSTPPAPPGGSISVHTR